MPKRKKQFPILVYCTIHKECIEKEIVCDGIKGALSHFNNFHKIDQEYGRMMLQKCLQHKLNRKANNTPFKDNPDITFRSITKMNPISENGNVLEILPKIYTEIAKENELRKETNKLMKGVPFPTLTQKQADFFGTCEAISLFEEQCKNANHFKNSKIKILEDLNQISVKKMPTGANHINNLKTFQQFTMDYCNKSVSVTDLTVFETSCFPQLVQNYVSCHFLMNYTLSTAKQRLFSLQKFINFINENMTIRGIVNEKKKVLLGDKVYELREALIVVQNMIAFVKTKEEINPNRITLQDYVKVGQVLEPKEIPGLIADSDIVSDFYLDKCCEIIDNDPSATIPNEILNLIIGSMGVYFFLALIMVRKGIVYNFNINDLAILVNKKEKFSEENDDVNQFSMYNNEGLEYLPNNNINIKGKKGTVDERIAKGLEEDAKKKIGTLIGAYKEGYKVQVYLVVTGQKTTNSSRNNGNKFLLPNKLVMKLSKYFYITRILREEKWGCLWINNNGIVSGEVFTKCLKKYGKIVAEKNNLTTRGLRKILFFFLETIMSEYPILPSAKEKFVDFIVKTARTSREMYTSFYSGGMADFPQNAMIGRLSNAFNVDPSNENSNKKKTINTESELFQMLREKTYQQVASFKEKEESNILKKAKKLFSEILSGKLKEKFSRNNKIGNRNESEEEQTLLCDDDIKKIIREENMDGKLYLVVELEEIDEEEQLVAIEDLKNAKYTVFNFYVNLHQNSMISNITIMDYVSKKMKCFNLKQEELNKFMIIHENEGMEDFELQEVVREIEIDGKKGYSVIYKDCDQVFPVELEYMKGAAFLVYSMYDNFWNANKKGNRINFIKKSMKEFGVDKKEFEELENELIEEKKKKEKVKQFYFQKCFLSFFFKFKI